MKALVYHGPGKQSWEEKPKPSLQEPTDAIVRITKTTICGTDLHIMKGDVPEVKDGRILGHEGVGIIEEIGSGVLNFKKGDHVLISCISSCSKCASCRKGMYSHCENGGGWVLGHLIDGTQAEFVRIPFADTSLYRVPKDADENALVMLSDIFPTGFECGVLNGQVQPGSSVAIVGAGPIGLATLLTAQFYSPSMIAMIDIDENRLAVAGEFGASHLINNSKENVVEKIMELTADKGVDIAVEAVGVPSTFEICEDIVTAGGHIANIGVHGKPALLKLEKLWDRNITITTRLVDSISMPMLLKIFESGKLSARKMITHEFKLNEMLEAYRTFEQASENKALKVLLKV